MPSLGSRDLIYSPFYEQLPSFQSAWPLKPGQLYWCHIAYPETNPQILKLSKNDPRNERNNVFTITGYREGDERHYPIKELNLRDNELLYVFKGKRRLVVILGYIEGNWHTKKSQKHVLCAPVFSFKDYHSQEMVIKTQAFHHPNLFYLPQDIIGCPNESVIRLELIQPVTVDCLSPFSCSLTKKPTRLTDETYWLLLCRLIKFLNGKIIDTEIEEFIDIYSALLIQSFDEASR